VSQPLSILIVDDDELNRDNLGALLGALGYRTECAVDGVSALGRLERGAPPDVIILDVLMPGLDGMETLRRYRAAGGRAPVVMCSALDETETVMRAVRAGASDYVTKPLHPEELGEIIERVAGSRPTTVATPLPAGANRLGASAAMRAVDRLVDRIADADVPVLITGESGVGKDVVAREIHARSTRSKSVFIKINCAALPGELLESELFGHERGSFTGAQRTKPGQFELAHGGTLFLDEIGEMPVSLQAKLLQALQDGEFYRVGGQRKIKVDARVIVATNRDLGRAMAEGSFREDLYYRLNVVQITIPPLRDRRDDIPQLLEIFAEKYGKRYGRSPEPIPREILERFRSYDFPGNIRELENLVRRLMVLRDPHFVLAELKDRPLPAPATVPAGQAAATIVAAGVPIPAPPRFSYPPTMTPPVGVAAIAETVGGQAAAEAIVDDYRIDLKDLGRKAANAAEREAIILMLSHTGGNKREAAERLGISYKAILYKIRDFGIGRPRAPRRPIAPPPAVASAPPAGGNLVETTPAIWSAEPVEASAGD
jgi:DNA-binding NtrC family response regulator